MQITNVTAVYPKYRHHVVRHSDSSHADTWRSVTLAAPDETSAFGRRHFWQIVVRVESSTGHTGLGMGGGGIAAVEVVNRHFRELLIGRRVESVEHIQNIWDDLYYASIPYGRRGIGIMALSGVDIALWDLLGHAERKPVSELIGGLRKQRVRAYAMGVDTMSYRDLGYTAHKLPHLFSGADSDYEDMVAAVALARDAFGPDAPLMIDNYKSWNTDVTLEMALRLAEFNVYFFEDVLTPDGPGWLGRPASARQAGADRRRRARVHPSRLHRGGKSRRIGPLATGCELVRRRNRVAPDHQRGRTRKDTGRTAPGRRGVRFGRDRRDGLRRSRRGAARGARRSP